MTFLKKNSIGIFFRVCLFFRFSFRCEISLNLDPVEFHSNCDPLKNSDAEEFQSISIREAAVLVPDDKLDCLVLKTKIFFTIKTNNHSIATSAVEVIS